MTKVELTEVLSCNNWYVEEAEEGYDLSAGFLNEYFNIFIDIKFQKKGNYKFKLTQTIQNNDDDAIFSFLYFFTNDIRDLIEQLGNQNPSMNKENYSNNIRSLLKSGIVILSDDLKGNIMKLEYNET